MENAAKWSLCWQCWCHDLCQLWNLYSLIDTKHTLLSRVLFMFDEDRTQAVHRQGKSHYVIFYRCRLVFCPTLYRHPSRDTGSTLATPLWMDQLHSCLLCGVFNWRSESWEVLENFCSVVTLKMILQYSKPEHQTLSVTPMISSSHHLQLIYTVINSQSICDSTWRAPALGLFLLSHAVFSVFKQNPVCFFR